MPMKVFKKKHNSQKINDVLAHESGFGKQNERRRVLETSPGESLLTGFRHVEAES